MAKKKKSKPRNFVAKNATKSGAGRHADKKNNFERQPRSRDLPEGFTRDLTHVSGG